MYNSDLTTTEMSWDSDIYSSDMLQFNATHGGNANITNRSPLTVLDRIPNYFIFKIVFNIPFASLILISNMFTLMAIHRNLQLRNVTNIFLASLSFSDLLNVVPIMVIRLLVFVEDDRWSHGLYMFIFAALTLSSSLSIYSHAALALDRLIAIIYPFSYKQIVTAHRAHVITISIWLFNITTVSFMMVYFGRNMKDIQAQMRCILHLPLVLPHEIYYGVVMPEIIIFLSISGICYARIFIAIKYRTRFNATGGTSSRPRDNEMAHTAAMTTAIILLVLLGCWAPFSLLTAVIDIKKFYTIPSYFFAYEFSVYLLYSNSFLNPLILYLRNREFRKAYRDIMCLREQQNSFQRRASLKAAECPYKGTPSDDHNQILLVNHDVDPVEVSSERREIDQEDLGHDKPVDESLINAVE